MLTPSTYGEDVVAAMNNAHDMCSEHLAQRLINCELGLFLGSGVSSGLGLPMWEELVKQCCEKVAIANHGISIDPTTKRALPPIPRDTLLTLMSRVRRAINDDNRYHEIIKECLYQNVTASVSGDPLAFLQKPLLLALGSLISGSVNGKVADVITYNFDGILEWYLSLHGYQVSSVQAIPSLKSDSDIFIYHPHGFLPLGSHWTQSDFVLFDKKAFEERFNPIVSNPWWTLLAHILTSKQFILVGIDDSEPTLGPMLNAVSKVLEQNPMSTRKIIGFWLFHDSKKDADHMRTINEYGCVPLYFTSYDDMPRFLIRIRQIAAGIVLS